ncbi:MAG: sigma-70 family RNA polymerase sigma factor [Saprospiraceae bacterium]|nr:sigma-70 family RNA polymerase sigma factor [Saprospiraceae bacterium]MCB0624013.1 sigma-70 family RNA polymerase sigma factor [Saprospiraceae bacterium]MCB0682434.1 sigma-70 family RNA polymerase sigma factor [Saprospiraceae bacterium]
MSDTAHISDDHIVGLLRADARQAMDPILQKYGGALYWAVFKIAGTKEVAEDVLQEAFVKIWKSADSYDEDKGKLFTWLLQIARNKAIDRVRTGKFQANRTSRSIDETVYEQKGLSEEMSIGDPGLRQQVEKLDPKYRQIIELVYFQGYTQAEITEELGLPLGTVKGRVKIALRELRKLLGRDPLIWISGAIGLDALIRLFFT